MSQSSSNNNSTLVKQALDMLEMVKTATKSVGSAAGLFMDELASVFDAKSDQGDLHDDLIDWISEKMAKDFEEEYVEDVAEGDEDRVVNTALVPLKLAYGIEYDNHLEANAIALNLGHMVASNKGSSAAKAARLIPHFRLLSKCIAKQQDGKMDDLDAVLGCPIWMIPDETYEKLDSISNQELNAMCDANFYCLNWFRELINTFSNDDKQDFEDKRKVILRVKNILKVEDNLKKVLAKNIGYTPPTMLHLEDSNGWQPPTLPSGESKSKGGKKKGKKRKAVQDITNNTNIQSETTVLDDIDDEVDENSLSTKIDLQTYKPFFREWDLCVFKILTCNLLTISSEPAWDQELKDPKIRPQEFIMLMKDLNLKLSHILLAIKTKKAFPGKSKTSSNIGFSNLNQMGALNVAKVVVPLIEYILADAEVVAEYFKNLIDLYDGDITSQELYRDNNYEVFNTCLELVFEFLKVLFSWNGFQEQAVLLKLAMSKFANRSNKVDKDKFGISELASKSLEYLCDYKKCLLSVGCANAHLKLVEVIDTIGTAQSPLVHKTSKEYLTRQWFGKGKVQEKGAKFNTYIDTFLTLCLKTAENDEAKLKIIEDYANNGIMPMTERDFAGFEEERFVALNKGSVATHYRVLMNSLLGIIKKLSFSIRLNNASRTNQLKIWGDATTIFKVMLDVIKNTSSPRALLIPLLKTSRSLLDHFLRHGMPLMDKMFNEMRSDCTALLKNMQLCTRYLQHVCSFSRTKSDASLATHVPPLRKLLEQFVFRVKAMLALNNNLKAFWLGNLKNRDLAGKELNTSQMVEEDYEEDDEVLDDDESDVDLPSVENDGVQNEEVEEESLEY